MINEPRSGHSDSGGMVSMVSAGGPLGVLESSSPPAAEARSPATSATTASSGTPALSKQDAERFRTMVDTNFDFIWRSLRGLGVPASSIDDAAQQVFWTASQKISTIAVGSERSFLFATARGIASNARRSQLRNRELLDEEAIASHVDRAPDPEQIAATRQARQLLDRILDGLSEELRAVFLLYELEGQTMAEIASILGTPMGTVASRLRRAREEFQSAARRYQAAGGSRT
jgi:RNA polymerase sigma-70 factor (ECF subfamily)